MDEYTPEELKQIEQLKLKYPCIVEWCRVMQSFEYYVINQLFQAEKDNAPRNAIYTKDDGKWETADGISNPAYKYINSLVK